MILPCETCVSFAVCNSYFNLGIQEGNVNDYIMAKIILSCKILSKFLIEELNIPREWLSGQYTKTIEVNRSMSKYVTIIKGEKYSIAVYKIPCPFLNKGSVIVYPSIFILLGTDYVCPL